MEETYGLGPRSLPSFCLKDRSHFSHPNKNSVVISTVLFVVEGLNLMGNHRDTYADTPNR